jgi:uncharacterized protein
LNQTQLSRSAARSLQLHIMGLAAPMQKRATRTRLLRAIDQMQLLQLDTISVVNRSPHLVLYARCGAYPLVWLDQLLAQGSLFEVWAHEACLAPKSLLWLLRAHASDRQHWSRKNLERVMATDRIAMNQLLKQIRLNGPVKSSDFEQPESAAKPAGGWWNWKPHKRYLEAWFAAGELMISQRQGSARVYDLAQRVCPELIDPVAVAQAKRHYTPARVSADMQAIAVKSLGIVTARWINDFFRTTPYVRDVQLSPLLDAGTLLTVRVEGSNVPWYVHRDHQALLRRAARNTLAAPSHCAFLSPFDPLVWQRPRASEFFDFDYRIECYTPQAKRQFGYFTLPVLYHNQLIGRVDAKAHRSDSLFEIKALHFEDHIVADDVLLTTLGAALQDFAHWHQCPQVVIRQVWVKRGSRPRLATQLRAAVKKARAREA